MSETGRKRRSIRRPGFDYSPPGAYFVTVVTQGRECLFGEIREGETRLSDKGQIAEAGWRSIPAHFPQTELGAFVVMPNHVHDMLVLHNQRAAIPTPPVGAQHAAMESKRIILFVLSVPIESKGSLCGGRGPVLGRSEYAG